MSRFAKSASACLVALLVAGCASSSELDAGKASDEPVAHEYRTGSIIAQKEKHVTTDEERRRAQEVAAEIRSSPQSIPPRP